jgi:hypothetical protein
MDLTQEQRDIIRRIVDVSARFGAATTAVQTAQAAFGRNPIDILSALDEAINRSSELVTIHKQYSVLLQELLDTL